MTQRPLWLLAFSLCLLLVGGCGVPGPAGPVDTYGLDFSLPDDAPRTGVVLFVVDGVNAEVFDEMLQAGKLPALRKYFVDRGLYARRAVANTPSVTMANLTSLATGQFPGHHGVVGVNWFDRDRLIWRDYATIAQKNTLDGDYRARTVYEYLRDELTFSIFFQPHRGAGKFVENWTSAGPPFFFGWYEFVDRLTLFRFHLVMDMARRAKRFPAVTVVYLLAADMRGYGHGVGSEEYRGALVHTDRQIGRVLGDMERAGLLEHIMLVFVSDHGLGDVTAHFPPGEFLTEQVGLDLAEARLWEEHSSDHRRKVYADASAVPYGGGDRYWALCLRKPLGHDGQAGFYPWGVRPSGDDLRAYPTRSGKVDLPDALCGQQAVDVVAYATGANTVRVVRRSGEVEFSQPAGRGGEITYRLVRGSDPLGWSGKVPPAALTGRPMGQRQWLAATLGTDYPDLPAQILAYFRSPYAGDLAVFATPGWDFNNVHRAGHGGLRGEDMFVPLLLAGPGIPHGDLDSVRTVDLMPTVLTFLGRPVPPGLDGVPILP